MDNISDWRITNQEAYLKDQLLYHRKYSMYSQEWDHDHCEFCFERFSENDQETNIGYCTKDKYYWICEECFNDFKEMFNWSVVQ